MGLSSPTSATQRGIVLTTQENCTIPPKFINNDSSVYYVNRTERLSLNGEANYFNVRRWCGNDTMCGGGGQEDCIIKESEKSESDEWPWIVKEELIKAYTNTSHLIVRLPCILESTQRLHYRICAIPDFVDD